MASTSSQTAGRGRSLDPAAARARRKFLRFFPGGFQDETYLDWERDYKVEVHEAWEQVLHRAELERLLKAKEFDEVCRRAMKVEGKSRHSMLFSFEKMALRDAVREPAGAKAFALGLHDALWGKGTQQDRFNRFGQVLDGLPRKQTRVHTWPLHTIFGFIAKPKDEIFLKPKTMKKAAEEYGFDFQYASRPNWTTYASLLEFAQTIARDQADLGPRDLIDLQSFIWVLGSDEYA